MLSVLLAPRKLIQGRLVVIFTLVASFAPSLAVAQDTSGAAADIQKVIQEAYIEGVFIDRNPEAVRSGFHPQFVMSVPSGASEVILASLDMWLERLALDGTPTSDEIRSTVDQVDITGSTAVVKMRLWINDRHTYTDYLGLYRFADGWKIVTKVFSSHD